MIKNDLVAANNIFLEQLTIKFGGKMKFLRFGNFGEEKPGICDEEGFIRDLSVVVNDIAG